MPTMVMVVMTMLMIVRVRMVMVMIMIVIMMMQPLARATLCRYLHEQGFPARPMTADELFARMD